MSALVFNFEEITARELKPALLELDGISRGRRGALQAVRGLRREAERDPHAARRRRPLDGEPGRTRRSAS